MSFSKKASQKCLSSYQDDLKVRFWINFRDLYFSTGLTSVGGVRRDRTDDLKLAKLPLSQLSYDPAVIWWAWQDLNLRPHAYQACALTNWATSPDFLIERDVKAAGIFLKI